mmetsp:Transcript_62662/g.177157  ORF Transcript_62662/g.177157 Transcript_62662/m.177157 type:complete len:106 (+) Transcript_62662:202-519(+)
MATPPSVGRCCRPTRLSWGLLPRARCEAASGEGCEGRALAGAADEAVRLRRLLIGDAPTAAPQPMLPMLPIIGEAAAAMALAGGAVQDAARLADSSGERARRPAA